MSEHTAVLSVKGISKSFSEHTVLRDVELEIFPGEIHGLVGENGSGKSTLVKILSGFHAPDDLPGAAIEVRGTRLSLPLDPSEQTSRGVAFVHQDLGLVDTATVTENIRLKTRVVGRAWKVSWRAEHRYVGRLLEQFGLRIRPTQQVSELSHVERTQVAIVRAFDQLSGVTNGLLVLDEPTASLPRDGTDQLLTTVREVAAAGMGVLLVTHRLEEILAVTHRVTVLRDGRRVTCVPTTELDEHTLMELILGQSLDAFYPEPHTARAEMVARFVDVSGPTVDSVSFQVHRGEVVGLTGLIGMGWDDLPYILFGARAASGGTVELEGVGLTLLSSMTPRTALRYGMALLPAERLIDASLQTASVKENLTLATLGRYFSGGLLNGRAEAKRASSLLHEYDVRPPRGDRPLSTLSGGNQQKVLIAKWFETNPRLLLLHEPIQGVDVGAQAQIFRRIRDAAEEGLGIVLASAEYEHLPHICDRVLVFRDGRIVNELKGESMTPARIAADCFRSSRNGERIH